MSDPFVQLLPAIVEAFGIANPIDLSGPTDLTDMISKLGILVEPGNTELLGEILWALAAESSSSSANFGVPLSLLQDKLQLGLEYSQNPRSMYGGLKVIGREIFQIIESLDPVRRKVVAEWQALAIKETLLGAASDSFVEEEIETMRDILRWLSGGAAPA